MISFLDLSSHPCNRKCKPNKKPMTCIYNFQTKDQYTDKSGRIADGRKRAVLTYNDILPGTNYKIYIDNRTYLTLP